MRFARKINLPYSEEGLKLLQRTLALQAELTKPVLQVEASTGALRVQNLDFESNHDENT